ncbi:MAG: DUF393 domain-containing protein [Chlamydiales bacterium]|nr:DUF393 domain-containing protein [Chlamydiales bacterium]
MRHIIFYDSTCGLCDHAVQFLIRQDKNKCLLFAPLQGITAKEKFGPLLDSLLQEDTLVLLENEGVSKEKYYLRAKAVFRALWYIGGIWRLIGWHFFLPTFFYDYLYRVLAKNRRSLGCPLIKNLTQEKSDRFLP